MKYERCNPTGETAAFVLQISGRMLKLDSDGNRKAAEAWKEYAKNRRARDPDWKTSPVTAIVGGAVSGDEIKVDTIELR